MRWRSPPRGLRRLAFERAIHGTTERLYKDGELVAERRAPDNRLLMWLLSRHDPVNYGWLTRPQPQAPDPSFFPVQHARKQLPALIEELADVDLSDCPAERLSLADFDAHEDPSRA
jgi:hypothetical protein